MQALSHRKDTYNRLYVDSNSGASISKKPSKQSSKQSKHDESKTSNKTSNKRDKSSERVERQILGLLKLPGLPSGKTEKVGAWPLLADTGGGAGIEPGVRVDVMIGMWLGGYRSLTKEMQKKNKEIKAEKQRLASGGAVGAGGAGGAAGGEKGVSVEEVTVSVESTEDLEESTSFSSELVR